VQQHNITIDEIIKIAYQAGALAMQFYDRKYTIKQKQNKTPVTEADIIINDYLIKELLKYDFPILSEEIKDEFKERKNAEFFWIIDPLDGTSDFIQKSGEFSIMIGLVNKEGESVLGVVYAPALDELYWAQKNKGAFFVSLQRKRHCEERLATWQSLSENSQKIQVSKNQIKNGKILISRNHLRKYEQQIAKKYNMEQIPTGSAGLKICWIARGDAELYINSSDRCGLWDTCAADIILQEAGGYITDKECKTIFYNVNRTNLLKGFIVSNVKKCFN
jgi:3'(2'), 5'-bisphosphate nucleotidase